MHHAPAKQEAQPPPSTLAPVSASEQLASLSLHDASAAPAVALSPSDITYRCYRDEDDIPVIMDLIAPYLSEPYSIYCYRYFLHGWPQLCTLACHGKKSVGVIVCKQDLHRHKLERGYIAMLSTEPAYRSLGIATTLVERAIATMRAQGAQEVVLETEVDNRAALRLYERMGFIRAKRLYRFYLNATDAFRLILPLEPDTGANANAGAGTQAQERAAGPTGSESSSEEDDDDYKQMMRISNMALDLGEGGPETLNTMYS